MTDLKFDIVIGNPPYINSQVMCKTNPDIRNLYSKIFESAKGSWDAFVIFIEKGFKLLKDKGLITYIVPNKLLSAKYTEAIRKILQNNKIIEIRDYSSVKVFKGQGVYPIVFVVQKTQDKKDVLVSSMSSLNEYQTFKTIPSEIFYKDINWNKYFADNEVIRIILKISENLHLSSLCPLIFKGTSVNETYLVSKHIKEYSENINESFKKLINTGTVDPYTSLWGVAKTRLIKKTYTKPIILDTNIAQINPKRLKQANSKKIVIAGMSKRIECFVDTEGEYMAVAPTIVILDSSDNKINLKTLAGILNSKLISFWYKHWFKTLVMSNGFLSIRKDTIKAIPIPKIKIQEQHKIMKLVDEIVKLKKQSKDTSKLENEIDKIVYKIYKLTSQEMNIVKKFVI